MVSRISLFICLCLLLSAEAIADRLVILHTNDTHSQIEPAANGLGGIARRKVLIDSVRNVNRNVLLVDAGDMVQGTLYFTLFGGEVESKLMNSLGYDIQILGNHEFDNGLDELLKLFGSLNAKKISTNYDFTDTQLSGIFDPFVIKEFDGKKIGFLAINLDPKGMISETNSKGIVYLDGIKAANATAWYLKHIAKADIVIAVTHIGYNADKLISDLSIARKSEDIDIIIGGHTHTLIDPADSSTPAFLVENAVGRPVLIAQAGGRGYNVGEIDIDLDSLTAKSSILPVDGRYDRLQPNVMDSIISPYRDEVEKFRNFRIGKTKGLKKSDWSLVNWMADFVLDEGATLVPEKIDMAIVNKGGVRADLASGNVTKGDIMQIFPFDNRVEVIRISGKDLREALDVMASRGGDGVSREVDAAFDPESGKCISINIGGVPLVENREYIVATIDYLARGGDYMESLMNGEVIGSSENILYKDIIDALQHNKVSLKADRTLRMHPEK